MKKNVLFIVVDSVTNDVIFNKENSKEIAPFLNDLRKKSISGDKMFSEAPYTEAALMSLLGSVDTMDHGGYMQKMKYVNNFLEDFQREGYKTFFCNYYPSIYPSYIVKGYDERRYIDGFHFSHLWAYRFKYFSTLYLENKTTVSENEMLYSMLNDNFNGWIEYLEKIKMKSVETILLNDCVDLSDIDETIKQLKDEQKKLEDNQEDYLKKLFIEKEEHILFKINEHQMKDKIGNDEVRKKIIDTYYPVFKKIKRKNLKVNLLNNRIPVKKLVRSIIDRNFVTTKGLLAGYKNSLFDKDIFERINNKFDLFKDQRSFHTVSLELMDWIKKNKDKSWVSYVHIDDAHYNENFFTYDTTNLELIDSEFEEINKYLDNLPKKYKGSIAYDLSLHYCDNIIKNIFKFLENEKLLEDTNVVITADHGFSYYFSPVREKYVISNYKENYNVPFIIYGKNITPKMINDYCSTKDIPVTLLSLAGIKPNKQYKGNNLLEDIECNYALLEYMGGGCPDIFRRPINLGVRTDNYSVVVDAYISKEFSDIEIKEIYDLNIDPYEHNNLKNTKDILLRISDELTLLERRFLEIKKQYEGEKND